jgi:hypothetical protein
VIPSERLAEIQIRKGREHKERDGLLDRLQLGGVVNGTSMAIGGNRFVAIGPDALG